MAVKSDFWGAVVGSVIVVGLPALVWGGSISARVEDLTTKQVETRRETREDIKELNRKMDEVLSRLPAKKD